MDCVDQEIDGLDADERDDDAAQAVDEEIAPQVRACYLLAADRERNACACGLM